MTPSKWVFHGRSREIGLIRSALDGADASVLRVYGMRGVGKSALVARAVQDFPHVIVRMPALPEPLQRRVLNLALSGDTPGDGGHENAASSPPTWDELFARAMARARTGRAPFVLVLDDASRLSESRARFERPLARTLEHARTHRHALHVILVGGPPEGMTETEPYETEVVALGPLPLRTACPMLPGGSPREVLRAYGVLGGIPAVLRNVDPSLTLETNVRKLMLEPEAPFADLPGHWLERDLQTPSRYNAVLRHLALGESDWGKLRSSVPDLTSSGQLAPYVRRLEELGLVHVRRSLDAPPKSRARRYQVVDPFLAFWYRFIHPTTWEPSHAADASPDALVRAMRPTLEIHLERIFPLICRQHMRHDALETLGANAREIGSLWSQEYEVPVAGILGSGAAFYGACFWEPLSRGDDPLGPLDDAARGTRYGFGREKRLRLVFTSTDPPRWLERAALRREQAFLIGPEALTGA